MTNDDEIKLTGKMVTFTPLMSAHNILREKKEKRKYEWKKVKERQERERESNT